MPGRGRKATPTKKKELSGNPGKRKLNKNEPEYGELSIDTPPPDSLEENGRIMWAFLLRELQPQGILFKTDLETLSNFCIAYQNRILAQKGISKYGVFVENANGGLSKNPAFTVLNEAMRQMATFGALLGLDPSSRSRLVGNADKDTGNPFAELLQ
ncbi:Phage terminase, small subunit [Phocoenobacter uteri]|uniref:Phage terminase, small subunit n=2 Tax=Phocoenobacter uteri TaxID=146806 RepID=A0A379C9K1_9PAST|nr:Phage terminase, small subunit [Phocoenobacter uteri]